MKRILLLLILCLFAFSVNLYAKNDATSDSKTRGVDSLDKKGMTPWSNFDTIRLLYWTNYGTTGLFSFINNFAFLGYASSISDEMRDVADTFQNLGFSRMSYFRNAADALPYVVFGVNFLISGTAHIPQYGGIVYGSLLYSVGILNAILRIFDPIDLIWYYEIPANIGNSYKKQLSDIHNKMFDPVPYFTLGTISIIFGICEIITTYFYQKEIKKRKYPIMNKILSFSPNGIIIKLDG